jgi:hypothetical protein
VQIAVLVLEYLRVLVWPALVVVLVAILLPQVRSLLERVRSARIMGLEAVFESAARVISDPSSSDEQRQLAIQISADVASEVSASDTEVTGYQYEQAVQIALLRVLQNGHVEPLAGPGRDQEVDFLLGSEKKSASPLPVVVKLSIASTRAAVEVLRQAG